MLYHFYKYIYYADLRWNIVSPIFGHFIFTKVILNIKVDTSLAFYMFLCGKKNAFVNVIFCGHQNDTSCLLACNQYIEAVKEDLSLRSIQFYNREALVKTTIHLHYQDGCQVN